MPVSPAQGWTHCRSLTMTTGEPAAGLQDTALSIPSPPTVPLVLLTP